MDSKEIQELLKLVNRLELAEFKYKQGDLEFSVRTKYFLRSKQGGEMVPSFMPMPPMVSAPPATHTPPQPSEVKQTAEADSDSTAGAGSGAAKENLIEIRSPIVGTFYRSASPEKGPYVKPGDKIEV